MFGKAAMFGSTLQQVMVDRAAGTIFGKSSPVGGGFASVFDGVIAQNHNQGCNWSGTDGYIGKAFSAAKLFSKVVCYSTTDYGFAGPNVTLSVYGKNGSNPSSRTDGTLLATTGVFTDVNGAAITIDLPGLAVAYDRLWVSLVDAAGAYNCYIAEMEIYELI